MVEELATDRITDDRDDHRSFQPYDDPTAGISISLVVRRLKAWSKVCGFHEGHG